MTLLSKDRLMAGVGFSAGEVRALEDQICAVGNSTPPSAGGASTNPNGNCFTFVGAAGNGADTTEDTLASFTLPANSFDQVGRGVHVYAFGSFASNTNTKHAKLYFGSEVLSTGTGNNVSWSLEIWSLKSAANVQKLSGQPIVGTTHGGVNNQAGAETDTAPIVIKVTGQDSTSANANSIVLNGMFIEFMN